MESARVALPSPKCSRSLRRRHPYIATVRSALKYSASQILSDLNQQIGVSVCQLPSSGTAPYKSKGLGTLATASSSQMRSPATKHHSLRRTATSTSTIETLFGRSVFQFRGRPGAATTTLPVRPTRWSPLFWIRRAGTATPGRTHNPVRRPRSPACG